MNLQGWIGIAGLICFPAAFAWAAARTGRRGGLPDRCRLLTGAATAAFGLVLGRAVVPWDVVAPALWGAAAAVTAWGAITAALVWPRLPAVHGARPRLRLAGTGLELALSIAVVVALI